MEYLKQEKVISIKELVYAICSKWRSVLSVVMITAVLILVINLGNGLSYMDILTKTVLISAIIKQIILISIVALFIVVFIYAVKFIFSDSIKTETELRMTMKIELLGNISDGNFKRNTWIDRKLRNYVGIKACENTEMSVERVANIIRVNKDVKYKNNKIKIAIVSSYSLETAQKCTEMLKSKISGDIDIVLAGDIMDSANAVKTVTDASCIILAECIKKSKYSLINDVCHQLSIWDKDIMGIVITD